MFEKARHSTAAGGPGGRGRGARARPGDGSRRRCGSRPGPLPGRVVIVALGPRGEAAAALQALDGLPVILEAAAVVMELGCGLCRAAR